MLPPYFTTKITVMKNIGLVPLINFGVIDSEKEIFRCAQPQYLYQYRWIKNVLGVDTIINLRSECRHDDYMNKLHDLGFNVINVDVKDHQCPTMLQAQLFMSLVKAGKCIIHCAHGHGRTSTFSVLARIATGWTLDKAMKEEKQKFHYEFRHHIQSDWLYKNFKK